MYVRNIFKKIILTILLTNIFHYIYTYMYNNVNPMWIQIIIKSTFYSLTKHKIFNILYLNDFIGLHF